jgi:hypothetical protein
MSPTHPNLILAKCSELREEPFVLLASLSAR